ncbi:hypothetical protein JXO59_09715, partial [candidate division KSB1 bacterium]|nr:hypothetical protein [candidate division KSB1 bacterium]
MSTSKDMYHLIAIMAAFFMGLCFTSGWAQQPLKPDQIHTRVADASKLTLAQVFATSDSVGNKKKNKSDNVIYWTPAAQAFGYNLYRRKSTETAMPKTPVNGNKQIKFVSSCADFKTIIPEGSDEWTMLVNAFASLDTTVTKPAGGGSQSVGTQQSGSDIKSGATTGQTVGQVQVGADKTQPSQLEWQKKMQQPATFARPEVELCKKFDFGLSKNEKNAVENLALFNLKFRLVAGLAYIDTDVTTHEKYVYELRGVDAKGEEFLIEKDIAVTGGHYTPLSAPTGFKLTPGDAKILATWDRKEQDADYILQRNWDVTYRDIHDNPIIYDITVDLDGKPLTPTPGFVDYCRFDSDGFPTTHVADDITWNGPTNYVQYSYRVAARDILGRLGTWSSVFKATPTDQTPPMSPKELAVSPSEDKKTPSLILTWPAVTRDINGHRELKTMLTYKIYRAGSEDSLYTINHKSKLHFIAQRKDNPEIADTSKMKYRDKSPLLVPKHGEKDFYYRIICVDGHGNASEPSAIISGRIPDITPPGPTHVTDAQPDSDKITIFWRPNKESDLAGYQIYRSICDYGKIVYDPDIIYDCGFVLLGEVLVEDSTKQSAFNNQLYYVDETVDKGSSICYAYWVRAFDMARNVYSPDYDCPAGKKEYICQKVYEKTPPAVPIISSLKAKNNAVRIEWVASPVQDLRAFHVYRSESDTAAGTFVGCVLENGCGYPGRWPGMNPVCDSIPAKPNPQSVKGLFR